MVEMSVDRLGDDDTAPEFILCIYFICRYIGLSKKKNLNLGIRFCFCSASNHAFSFDESLMPCYAKSI